MDYVCPHCQGTAYLLETGSDGRVMTICTKCKTSVPADAHEDAGPGAKQPKRHKTP